MSTTADKLSPEPKALVFFDLKDPENIIYNLTYP
jgi:hypothetical protein